MGNYQTEHITFYVAEGDQNTRIWVDTCFILHPGFESFYQQIQKLRVKLHTPTLVLEEIQNVIQGQLHSAPVEASRNASIYRMVQNGISSGKIQLETLNGQPFSNGDAALLYAAITEFNQVSRQIFLTQDGKLAQSLYAAFDSVRPVLLQPNTRKLLVMGHRRDGGLLIHQPGTNALAPESEALTPYWVGFDVKSGTRAAAPMPIPVTAPAPGIRYMTNLEIVRLEAPLNGRIYSVRTSNGATGSCIIPPPAAGMGWKLGKLKELHDRLSSVEHPLILPEKLLMDIPSHAVAGALINLPSGLVSLRSCAATLIFTLPWESRCQVAIELIKAQRFMNRMGLVNTGINPEYVLIDPLTLSVKLLCCIPEIQIGDVPGSTYYGNPLAASAAPGQLLPTTAITPALAKLVIQLLSGGGAPTLDLDLLPLSDESRNTLRTALSGTVPMSARMLYRAVAGAKQKPSPQPQPRPAVEDHLGLCANPACVNAGRMVPLAKDSAYCRVCNGLVKETRVCRDDAQPFQITFGEAEFYQKKGFALPNRCPACRKNRAGGEQPKVPFPRPLNIL